MPFACESTNRQISFFGSEKTTFARHVSTHRLTIFVRTDATRFSNISESRRNHSSAVLFHFANLERGRTPLRQRGRPLKAGKARGRERSRSRRTHLLGMCFIQGRTSTQWEPGKVDSETRMT